MPENGSKEDCIDLQSSTHLQYLHLSHLTVLWTWNWTTRSGVIIWCCELEIMKVSYEEKMYDGRIMTPKLSFPLVAQQSIQFRRRAWAKWSGAVFPSLPISSTSQVRLLYFVLSMRTWGCCTTCVVVVSSRCKSAAGTTSCFTVLREWLYECRSLASCPRPILFV